MNSCFDTFSETITIFKYPQKTVIYTNPNYNFAFEENSDGSDSTYVPSSGQFRATVEFIDSEVNQRNETPILDIDVKNSVGMVRISVSGDGKAYMGNLEKVMIDGVAFHCRTQPLHRGMFSRGTFDYYLSKINDDNG